MNQTMHAPNHALNHEQNHKRNHEQNPGLVIIYQHKYNKLKDERKEVLD